jgi:hypothetical protein
MPLIRQGQSNSPKVLEGVLGIGDWLLPTELVAKSMPPVSWARPRRPWRRLEAR